MKRGYKFEGAGLWPGVYYAEEGYKPCLCTWTHNETGEIIQQVRVYKESVSPLQIQQHLVRSGRGRLFFDGMRELHGVLHRRQACRLSRAAAYAAQRAQLNNKCGRVKPQTRTLKIN